jgi:signal transduction histidine kinase
MRERLERLGGRLEIEATPRHGFSLNAFIALPGA